MVTLSLLGNLCVWSGIMKIAERAGLIRGLSARMRPILKFLFPEIPEGHKSLHYISTNIIANILGLGWAATPAGLAAMEQLQKINKEKDTASKSMCMFMILNMSSLQLVTMSVLTYRSDYGSANPSEIIGPGIFATAVSSAFAVVYAKIRERV
jgi:spore maturation protein A